MVGPPSGLNLGLLSYALPDAQSAACVNKSLFRPRRVSNIENKHASVHFSLMQRLSIARAMMHDPQVLFLDEPSAGLDPQTRLLLWEIIREYNHSGKTILLTAHNMEEADALCNRLAIIDHGRVIALGLPVKFLLSLLRTDHH
jgi:ABC-2 type transport system ATP-binding protein